MDGNQRPTFTMLNGIPVQIRTGNGGGWAAGDGGGGGSEGRGERPRNPGFQQIQAAMMAAMMHQDSRGQLPPQLQMMQQDPTRWRNFLQEAMDAQNGEGRPTPAAEIAVEEMEQGVVPGPGISGPNKQFDDPCPVCQDVFVEGEQYMRMPCKHAFHADCLMPWLKEHHTCPTCRHELPQEPVGPVLAQAAGDAPDAAAGTAEEVSGGRPVAGVPTFEDFLARLFGGGRVDPRAADANQQEGTARANEPAAAAPAMPSFDQFFAQLVGGQPSQAVPGFHGSMPGGFMQFDQQQRQQQVHRQMQRQEEEEEEEERQMQMAIRASLGEEEDRSAAIDRQAALDVGSLGVAQLRAVLARHGVDSSHCVERVELEALVVATVPPASFDDIGEPADTTVDEALQEDVHRTAEDEEEDLRLAIELSMSDATEIEASGPDTSVPAANSDALH
jgi:hypothetical protein